MQESKTKDTSRTKAQVQTQMRERSASMKRHVDALEAETTSAGHALQKWLGKNLLLGMGGAVAAGLFIGWLLSRDKRRDSVLSDAHSDLVDQYIDAVGEDVRQAVDAGEEAGFAVRNALRDHVPLVIYQPEAGGENHGFLGEAFDLVSKTAFSFAVRHLLDRAAGALGADADGFDKAVDDTGTVASAVSENVDG